MKTIINDVKSYPILSISNSIFAIGLDISYRGKWTENKQRVCLPKYSKVAHIHLDFIIDPNNIINAIPDMAVRIDVSE